MVDITNFVLHETGQPLHAFDHKRFRALLFVREAKEGEKITTLDDQQRELNPKMLVIADSEKPLVIAGIMGSVDAEVDDNTIDIVLVRLLSCRKRTINSPQLDFIPTAPSDSHGMLILKELNMRQTQLI